jgi:hypothetical protein
VQWDTPFRSVLFPAQRKIMAQSFLSIVVSENQLFVRLGQTSTCPYQKLYPQTAHSCISPEK